MGWSDGGEGATGDEQQEHTAGRTSLAAAGQGGDYQSQGLVLYKRRRFVFKSASPEDDGPGGDAAQEEVRPSVTTGG